MKKTAALALVSVALLAASGPRCSSCPRDRNGRIVRSQGAKRAFRHMNPCPATGEVSGACPGYVIDHIVPLACGGPDEPQNMQWQTKADARAKDRVERRDCGE